MDTPTISRRVAQERKRALANPPSQPTLPTVNPGLLTSEAPEAPEALLSRPHSNRRPESGAIRVRPDQASSPSENSGVAGPGARPGDSGSGGPKEEPRHTLNSILDTITSGITPAPLLLQDIGRRFTEARKLNKPEAWRQLQADLMHNSHVLCPAIMGYKDLITTVREIEDFMKGSVGQVGRSNEELMAEFLEGKGELALKIVEGGASADLPTIKVAEPVIIPVENSTP